MKSITTKHDSSQPVADTGAYLFDDWFDPIEASVRDRVRGFIQAMIEGELDEALMRPRYGRRLASSSGKDDGLAAICGRQDHGMEEQGIADLSAPYAGCRCLDRVGRTMPRKQASLIVGLTAWSRRDG
jgi:hypothetical protein